MRKHYDFSKGKPSPLGSVARAEGVNFAVFSASAKKVSLCLFKPTLSEQLENIESEEAVNFGNETEFDIPMYRSGDIWHVFVKGIGAGQLYGYRADGDYLPYEGKKFNPNKLLLDPYAKEIVGKPCWDKTMYAYKSADDVSSMSDSDSAPFMPKARVVADGVDEASGFDWDGDKHPKVPMSKTILYELNVKGMTALMPYVPEKERGKFLALSSPTMITYFKELGITTLNLMPAQNFFTNLPQMDRGVSNYWGYDSLCFFAPHTDYLVSGSLVEFKKMVKALHKENIEIVLDVVFNHSTESNHLGPTLAYKGLDNEAYYRPYPPDKSRYIDDTGCGASFNFDSEVVRNMVLDALRYWAEEMHVDGFRFDLAVTLARENGAFNPAAPLLKAMMENPMLKDLKLIMEPWDLGVGGYQLGSFPHNFLEWNDKYRNTIRHFFRGEAGILGDVAHVVTGSREIFRGRPLYASVNFVTAHDGFTLQDLVSYNYKHNQQNGEENRDGVDENFSWNSGVEGETDNLAINNLRQRRKAAMMAALLVSNGTPMMLYGDELGRTQRGNNNAYCQDNEISWIDWDKALGKDEGFTAVYNSIFWRFICFLIHFRKESNLFNNPKTTYKFFTPFANVMSDDDWRKSFARAISFSMECEGEEVFLIFNASEEDIVWKLPNENIEQGNAEDNGFEFCFDSWDMTVREKHKITTESAHANDVYNAKSFSVVGFTRKRK